MKYCCKCGNYADGEKVIHEECWEKAWYALENSDQIKRHLQELIDKWKKEAAIARGAGYDVIVEVLADLKSLKKKNNG